MHSPTSRLDTLNLMLSCVGLRPVSEETWVKETWVQGTNRQEVKMALSFLDDVTREVQTMGWGFNTEKHFPLTPNETGEIPLPPNLLKVNHFPCDPGLTMRKKGKEFHLYNPRTHNFVFKNTVYADVVWQFDFEDLPEAFRRYIGIRAARKFQDSLAGSHAQHVFQERDEFKALADLKDTDNQANLPNMLNQRTFPLLRR